MKNAALTNGDVLTAVAALLHHHGIDAKDRDIALGMEAPYLFIHQDGHYLSGHMLYTPQWLSLYLSPLGFRLHMETLQHKDALQRLKSNEPCALFLQPFPGVTQVVKFSLYKDRYFYFEHLNPQSFLESTQLILSSQKLSRCLGDTVQLLTLERITPQSISPIPFLIDSLDALQRFYYELIPKYRTAVTPEDIAHLSHSHLNPLLENLQPLVLLIGDTQLQRLMRALHHNLTHIGLRQDGPPDELDEYVPWVVVKVVIHGMRELIFDRLSALGIPDKFIDEKAKMRKPE